MIATGLRVVAALRAGAVPVARPLGVVHVHRGRLTRSGAAVPSSARPFCGTRSKRLRVVPLSVLGGPAGGRFCRTCTNRLPAALGTDDRAVIVDREDLRAAYAHLTIDDLTLAAAWCRTVDETHQVSRLVLIKFGPKPGNRYASTTSRLLWDLHDALETRRRRLANAAKSDVERRAVVDMRDTEGSDRRRSVKNQRRAAAVEKAQERSRAGSYLAPHERELVDSA